MLSLRSVVTQLPALRRALEGSKSQLLRIVCDMVSDERIDEIESLISVNLNDECGPAKVCSCHHRHSPSSGGPTLTCIGRRVGLER